MTAQNKIKTFGSYIKSLRLYRGFGLRELARQLGISAPYLSDLEKDKRGAPPVDLVRAIVKILDADSENIYAVKYGQRDGTCPRYILDGESVVNQDQWHHFAYTATETGSKLYIDGVLVDETEESVSCQSNYSPSFIGWHGANQSSYFYGLIDEIVSKRPDSPDKKLSAA